MMGTLFVKGLIVFSKRSWIHHCINVLMKCKAASVILVFLQIIYLNHESFHKFKISKIIRLNQVFFLDLRKEPLTGNDFGEFEIGFQTTKINFLV